MNEKIAVSDLLSSLNAAITMMTYSIEHVDNEHFRDILIDVRSEFDSLKWDAYLVAKEKGYYVPAAPAGQADIDQVKSSISS